MTIILTVIAIALLALLAWFLYRKYVKKEKTILHLPLQELGFKNVPGFPILLPAVAETVVNLLFRSKEVKQAIAGLTTEYTIQGNTASAYAFTLGNNKPNTKAKEDSLNDLLNEVQKSSDIVALTRNKLQDEGIAYNKSGTSSLTLLSLDSPEQFSLAWTTYGNVYRNASAQLLPEWSASLNDAEEATRQFFPTIAKYGVAYNLLILQKVDENNYAQYKETYNAYWTPEMDDTYKAGCLYIIDLTIYTMLQAQQAEGFTRFTPATFTWLKQNPSDKTITPFAVLVSGYNNTNAVFYGKGIATPSAWLYALQAVKTGVTVYGIWLGHVYHWHLVTASMVMTMFNNISDTHVISKILAPQSKYIIGFNDVLVLLWKKAAPPTSIKTAQQFLELIDVYAKDRTYFDDDPTNTRDKLGLKESDFTISKPWDMYPIMGYLLNIWGIVEKYALTFVDNTYANDNEVRNDNELQNWMAAASNKEDGNIHWLPPMDSKDSLKKVLTSLLYRITAHGISRMDNTANPAMTFVGNFPPCLQSAHIPESTIVFDTKELLQYMPNTGTIGEMITFYYTFVDSAPYEPIIPFMGVDDSLFFDGGKDSANNRALITLRNELVDFMKYYTESNAIPGMPANSTQIHQWPMSIET
jgi:hypothetical protein